MIEIQDLKGVEKNVLLRRTKKKLPLDSDENISTRKWGALKMFATNTLVGSMLSVACCNECFYEITGRPLSETLHDDVQFWKCENPILILVKEHEHLLELSNLFISQLPFSLKIKKLRI